MVSNNLGDRRTFRLSREYIARATSSRPKRGKPNSRMTKTIIFFSLLVLALSADRAVACSCMPTRPTCEAYKEAPAIFIALVTEIDPIVKDSKGPRYAHFSIERAFKGVTEKEIKMYQGTASGDCSLKFEQGKRYLIIEESSARVGSMPDMMMRPNSSIQIPAPALSSSSMPRKISTTLKGCRTLIKVIDFQGW